MRAFACTLSLFVGALGLIAAGCFVHVTGKIWWTNEISGDMPVLLWAALSVCPVAMAGTAGLVAIGLWQGCSSLCAKLRTRGADAGRVAR